MVFSIITRLREHQKTTVSLTILSLILAFAANLYGLFTGITVVLPHLFYIPIILAAFFYPRRGGIFAAVLSAGYLLMVIMVRPGNNVEFLSAAARCVVFVIIAVVVSYLSERVLARETEITKVKEEWERTFDAVPDLIALIDREHRIIRVNKAMADSLGISPEQAVGMKCYEIVHHSSAPPLNCPHAMLLKDGKEHAEEVHEDNLGGDFLVTTSPIYDAEGGLMGSVHIARDITTRKQVEEALYEKSQDLTLKVRELNSLYEIGRLVETSDTTDILLQALADFLPSAWQYPELTCARVVVNGREFRSGTFRESSWVQDARIIVHGQRTGKIEIFFLGNDSEGKRPFLTGETTLLNAIAERVGRVLERKKAEGALRESEERYRTIINDMQDIFYRTDLTGKITMLSPSAARLAGYDSNDEILGRDVTSVYTVPAGRDNLLAALREKGSVYAYPVDLRVRDGSIRHVTTSSHFYHDPQGTILGVEGVIHNITGQRQAEEALKEALKKLNMLSSITRHDILNQIMGLRTFLELSREDLKGTKHETFIEKEDQAAEAIQRQIEFTRFYQDIGVNAPKWQDAGSVIQEAAQQLSLPSIELHIEVRDVEIFADPLIVKVFFNLMENSLRHGERVTRVEFSSRESEAGLVITYRDNGTGITAEDKKKLFQKGFGKHTGLGLFLSREILAITGITITENGEPGKGVQFDMMVPQGAFRFSP
jgi:PAS domain S-box-containing protein